MTDRALAAPPPSAAAGGFRAWDSGALLIAVAALAWSGNFVVGRAVAGQVPPVALAFWRWTVGLAVVAVPAWKHLRADRAALLRSWRVLLLLSALGVAAFNTMVYVGLRTTTATNGVLLQSTMPLVILLVSYGLYRERVAGAQLAAIAVSLAGVLVVVSRGSVEALRSLSLAPGDGWILLAVLCYALYSVLLRRRPAVHPMSLIAVTFAVGALMLTPLYAWEHLAVEPLRPGWTALGAILYVALLPSVVAYLCFNRAVELIGANRAGQYLHLMPVFGTLLAAGLLGERLRGHHLLGIALIGAGIALAAAARGRPSGVNSASSRSLASSSGA